MTSPGSTPLRRSKRIKNNDGIKNNDDTKSDEVDTTPTQRKSRTPSKRPAAEVPPTEAVALSPILESTQNDADSPATPDPATKTSLPEPHVSDADDAATPDPATGGQTKASDKPPPEAETLTPPEAEPPTSNMEKLVDAAVGAEAAASEAANPSQDHDAATPPSVDDAAATAPSLDNAAATAMTHVCPHDSFLSMYC